MTIIHKIDEFLFGLFPRAKSFGDSLDILIEELTSFYSYSIYQPEV